MIFEVVKCEFLSLQVSLFFNNGVVGGLIDWCSSEIRRWVLCWSPAILRGVVIGLLIVGAALGPLLIESAFCLLFFSLLKKLLLHARVHFIATKLFLSQLLFPLLTLLTAAISAWESVEFFGVVNAELVSASATTENYVERKESLNYLKIVASGHFLTAFIEFLAFVTPGFTTFGFILCLRERIGGNKEGMTVKALEFQGILTLADTESCG